MGPFLPLLEVEIEHDYFAGGICRTLQLLPSADTAARLERSDCLVRSTLRGLVVLFDASRAEALRLRTGEPLRLHFHARSSDPHFANCTEAPVGPGEALVVLEGDRAVAQADGRWRLHQDAQVGSAELRRLEAGEAAAWLPRGPRRAPPPHFLLDLAVTAAEVDAALDGRPRRYHAHFGARAAVWKYCLFGDWLTARDDMQVVDLAQACEFSAAVDERLPDGQPLLAVRSAAPIALQERPDRRFQLRRRGNGADKVLVKRLPAASPRHLHREAVGGVPTLVSEIFVYR